MNTSKLSEDNLYKYIGYSLSAFNVIFLARMAWMILDSPAIGRTTFVLLGFSLLSILLFVAGLLKGFKRWFSFLYSIPGSMVWIFGFFILIKKGVRQILLPEPTLVFAEISFWFITLFLWLAGAFLVIFLRSLFFKALPLREKDRNQDTAAKTLLIGFLILLALTTGYWIYTQMIDPLPVYINYDPEYSYMLNSATPFIDLELYKRMDHPGTFMQLIGTGITILLKPLSLLDGSYPYVYLLVHPRVFLFCARLVILVLNGAVLYLFFTHFQNPKDWSTAIAGLSTLLAYFALHNLSYEFLTIWSPNAFNFAVGSCLLFLLYKLITKQQLEQRSLWIMSLAMGLGATFHVYMITLLITLVAAIFLAFLFEGDGFLAAFTAGLKSLLGAGIGYFIGTLIILPYYGSYIQWIKDIIIHQDTYGTGEVGVVSISDLTHNFKALVITNWPLFLFMALTLLTCLTLLFINRKQLQRAKRIWALLTAIYLQLGGLILIISKHPVNRYLLSAASLMPIILILLHKLFDIYQINSKIYFSLVLGGLAILLVKNISTTIENHNTLNNYLNSYNSEVNNLLEQYSSDQDIDRRDLEIYWTYGTYSPCYSLWLGNDFSKRRYTKEILELCPKDLQYDIWDDTIADTDETGLESLFDKRNNIILVGNKNTLEKFQNHDQIRILRSQFNSLGFIVYQGPQ
jgi:hypothetical protein